METRRMSVLLILAGAVQFFFMMQIAEYLYPGYSVSADPISDLGAGPEPSASIFNLGVIAFGASAMAFAYLMRSKWAKWMLASLAISGAGMIGVGIFTENAGPIHFYVSFAAFFFGQLAAILSYWMCKGNWRYASFAVGLFSMACMVLYGTQTYLGIGQGGMERMMFYPLWIWIMGMGFGLLAEA
jgi:hypothetical membrane protein